MNRSAIDLKSLVSEGKINMAMHDAVLHMTAERAIHDVGYNIRRDRITSFVSLPGRYRVPMRIDMEIRIDAPEMLLLIGGGHISFGSPAMENRRIEDMAEPSGKPRTYDNSITFDEFVTVSVIFNLKEMQILIGGEERYYSVKERYMKSKYFHELNIEGFAIGLTCTKRTDLCIRSITITEYDNDIQLIHTPGKIVDGLSGRPDEPQQKPTFDSCIAGLPDAIRNEVIKTAAFLKSLKNLKFKRIIDRLGNKISFVASDAGISYALYLSGNVMHHSLQWYIVTNSKPELWHRKANSLEDVLNGLSSTSPALAGRIFYNLNECIACREHCLAKTAYTYQGQRKTTCHGHIFFKMCAADFQDVRDFLLAIDSMGNG